MLETVVAFEGTIYEEGYGMIAQKVMRDKDLPAKSKAIYAYLCAFAGSIRQGAPDDREAFPGVKLMMKELGIGSDDTFYKFRKPLIEKGYLKVRQTKEGSTFSRNIYSIVAVPAPVKKEEEVVETAPDVDSVPNPKNKGTENKSPNNRRIISNSLKSISFKKDDDDDYINKGFAEFASLLKNENENLWFLSVKAEAFGFAPSVIVETIQTFHKKYDSSRKITADHMRKAFAQYVKEEEKNGVSSPAKYFAWCVDNAMAITTTRRNPNPAADAPIDIDPAAAFRAAMGM